MTDIKIIVFILFILKEVIINFLKSQANNPINIEYDNTMINLKGFSRK